MTLETDIEIAIGNGSKANSELEKVMRQAWFIEQLFFKPGKDIQDVYSDSIIISKKKKE